VTTLVVVSVPLVFLAIHYTTSGSPGDAVRGRDGRWRVNDWMITKLHGPGSSLIDCFRGRLSRVRGR